MPIAKVRAIKKNDYSFHKGALLSTPVEPGVTSAIGVAANWNEILKQASPLQQIIQSGEIVIPDIYVDASTPDATETVKGKTRIWGAIRGSADEIRLFPHWDGRKYAVYQALGTGRLSTPSLYVESVTGGNTITSNSTGFFIRYTTGTTSGQETRVGGSTAITCANPNFELYWKFCLQNTSGLRFHAAAASSVLGNSDTNATVSTLGLRFSPGVTTSFQWIYNDSVGNLNTTNSSVTPAAGTIYQLYIRITNGVYIGRLYDVDGGELDAITFNGEVPATSIAITHFINIFNTVGGVGSAVGFDFYSMGIAYE